MDTQKVEQYAGVVRKVSTGLKVWNIIGIVDWNIPTTAEAIKAVIKLINNQGVRFLIDSINGPPILSVPSTPLIKSISS